ncbi:hypothetical protein [Sphingomonas segetis]|jgi:hypothetical protein|uniref:hypothetical protein n=1 Tax=Sphingomonas segetis TaxID=1104779 RepID=UPI0012D2F6D4|nr:hypothetical protein [Sphingomonas segetis]
MSVEGMWAVYFGDVHGNEGANSGIVVLETERLFGGDSFIAYLGTYEAGGGAVSADFKTWAYNPTIVVQTAFGDVGPEPTMCRLEGAHDPNGGQMGTITGQVWRVAHPEVKLPVHMMKVAELP